MKYMFVEQYRSQFRVERMCHALEVSRGGYYLWRRRSQCQRDKYNEVLVREIKIAHQQSRELYGSPRIACELVDKGYQCSKNRIARLMRRYKIKAKIKRKFRRIGSKAVLATYSDNLLQRKFDVEQPNQTWVTDFTYMWTRKGGAYLVAVLDLFSRRIVGWAIGKQPNTQLLKEAMLRALWKRKPEPGLMVHSDRGSQYASYDYRDFLKEHGFVASMNRQGNCWDNAVMESFFHTLKMEHVYWCHYESVEEAESSLFNYIELFYNSYRRHSYLNYKNPAEFERLKNVS
ncbi:IS3 family transposase [bacterium]|nr:IS3 family transposase [bacterium]